jgi:hypothetical protein
VSIPCALQELFCFLELDVLCEQLADCRILALERTESPRTSNQSHPRTSIYVWSTHLTTSAALSAAGHTTSVCGVPFCSDAFASPDPLSGLKALRNAGSWSSDLGDSKEDVSRNAESRASS